MVEEEERTEGDSQAEEEEEEGSAPGPSGQRRWKEQAQGEEVEDRSARSKLFEDWRLEGKGLCGQSGTIGDYGIWLWEWIQHSPWRLGKVARMIAQHATSIGEVTKASGRDSRDLVPLPAIEVSAEDVEDMYENHSAGVHCRTRRYWHPLVKGRDHRLRRVMAWFR